MPYKESEYLDLTVGYKPKKMKKGYHKMPSGKMMKGKTHPKGKSILKGIKKAGAAFGKFADRLEAGHANVKVGDRVEVTKGEYSGVTNKIKAFIPGGIQVYGSGQVLNIRHGSYRKK